MEDGQLSSVGTEGKEMKEIHENREEEPQKNTHLTFHESVGLGPWAYNRLRRFEKCVFLLLLAKQIKG